MPASSSFVLAAAQLRALQLDSSRTAADRAAARKIQQNSQPYDSTLVTGPGSYALLTPMTLMGAAIPKLLLRGLGVVASVRRKLQEIFWGFTHTVISTRRVHRSSASGIFYITIVGRSGGAFMPEEGLFLGLVELVLAFID